MKIGVACGNGYGTDVSRTHLFRLVMSAIITVGGAGPSTAAMLG